MEHIPIATFSFVSSMILMDESPIPEGSKMIYEEPKENHESRC